MKYVMYSSTAALAVEKTVNGIFVIHAPFLEKKGDVNTYDWDRFTTSKLSHMEISVFKIFVSHIISNLGKPSKETLEQLHSMVAIVLGKSTYKNMLFSHGDKMSGLAFSEYKGAVNVTYRIGTSGNFSDFRFPITELIVFNSLLDYLLHINLYLEDRLLHGNDTIQSKGKRRFNKSNTDASSGSERY